MDADDLAALEPGAFAEQHWRARVYDTRTARYRPLLDTIAVNRDRPDTIGRLLARAVELEPVSDTLSMFEPAVPELAVIVRDGPDGVLAFTMIAAAGTLVLHYQLDRVALTTEPSTALRGPVFAAASVPPGVLAVQASWTGAPTAAGGFVGAASHAARPALWLERDDETNPTRVIEALTYEAAHFPDQLTGEPGQEAAA